MKKSPVLRATGTVMNVPTDSIVSAKILVTFDARVKMGDRIFLAGALVDQSTHGAKKSRQDGDKVRVTFSRRPDTRNHVYVRSIRIYTAEH